MCGSLGSGFGDGGVVRVDRVKVCPFSCLGNMAVVGCAVCPACANSKQTPTGDNTRVCSEPAKRKSQQIVNFFGFLKTSGISSPQTDTAFLVLLLLQDVLAFCVY